MTRNKKIFLILSLTLTIFLAALISTDNVMPWNRTEAIKTSLSWGGLADLPANTKYLVVKTKGGLLNRQFIVEFVTDQNSLDAWVNASYRIKQAVPKIKSENIFLYDIQPGENNAYGGHVTIDKKLNKVTIDMSWS